MDYDWVMADPASGEPRAACHARGERGPAASWLVYVACGPRPASRDGLGGRSSRGRAMGP